MRLTNPMRDLLWKVAQHKYGWTYVSRHHGQLQVADGLVARGLVEYSSEVHQGRSAYDSVIRVLDAGRTEIATRWPVSPLVLEAYEHQSEGWTPVTSCVSRRCRPGGLSGSMASACTGRRSTAGCRLVVSGGSFLRRGVGVDVSSG